MVAVIKSGFYTFLQFTKAFADELEMALEWYDSGGISTSARASDIFD